MIDIHCHILPEVDDGAKSWEIALEMCRIAEQDGIRHVVATPHANERYVYDRGPLQAKLEELRHKAGTGIEFSLGCDFHLSYENLQELQKDPFRYSICGSKYLLVEFSDYSVSPQVDDAMLRLGDLGLTPVITHPERNRILQQNLSRVLRWAELGCVVQVTGSALTGRWGQRAQQAAELLLRHQSVHVLASDGHDTDRRKPVLTEARSAAAVICGDEAAEMLVEGNPRAIVEGQALPYFPAPVVKAGR